MRDLGAWRAGREERRHEEAREAKRDGMQHTLVEGDHGLGLAFAVDVGHNVHHCAWLDLEGRKGKSEKGRKGMNAHFLQQPSARHATMPCCCMRALSPPPL